MAGECFAGRSLPRHLTPGVKSRVLFVTQNFCLLHTAKGFSLSPAYDLVPDIHHNREHRLSFPQDAGTLPPDRQVLQRIGKVQKVSDPEQIIEDVVQSMAKWQEVFRQYEVPENDIQRLEPGITQRLNRIEDPQINLDQGPIPGG